MVLGILTSIAACPAIIGTTEAVRQGQAQNAREKHRGTKTNLTAKTTKKSSQSPQIDGGMIVLRDHKVCLCRHQVSHRLMMYTNNITKLYIATPVDDDDPADSEELEFEPCPGLPRNANRNERNGRTTRREKISQKAERNIALDFGVEINLPQHSHRHKSSTSNQS